MQRFCRKKSLPVGKQKNEPFIEEQCGKQIQHCCSLMMSLTRKLDSAVWIRLHSKQHLQLKF